MKIAIDLSVVDLRKAGIGYYAYELVFAILEQDKSNEYYLYTHNNDLLKDFVGLANIVEIKQTRANFKWIFKVWRDLKKRKIDILISPSLFTFGILFKNTIQIIHDLAPIKHPEYWPKKASLFFKYQLWFAARRAKAFAAISQTTLLDLNKYFPKTKGKSYFIGAGLHRWTNHIPNSEELKSVKTKLNLPEKFFLSLSTIQPRKNYINTIKAFAEFIKENDNYKYVIAGQKGWYYEEVFETVKLLGLQDKVIFLGYTDEQDLPALLTLCAGLIFASFDEGFGLPCIEAYKYKAPVLTSDIPIMRETMKDKAIYVDPKNTNSIAVGMSKLVKKSADSDQKFLDIYSWLNVSHRLIKIYEHFKV